MGAYAYARPTSVEEAVSVLASAAEAGQRTQMLAGGTDVLVQMRSVDRDPRTLVDVKHIAETNRVEIGSDEVFVGAAVPSGVLNENEELKAIFPGLLESADLIGSTQIQGRASIGGNLCNSSPAGDTIPAIIAAGGVCVIAGPSGTREVACEDFLTGVGTNVLGDTEFLLGMRFPRPPARSGTPTCVSSRAPRWTSPWPGPASRSTWMRTATACTRGWRSGAVAPTALLVPAAGEALVGTRVDDAALAAAGAACSAAASPITDKRGTVEYRIKVVGVLCRRAGPLPVTGHSGTKEKS